MKKTIYKLIFASLLLLLSPPTVFAERETPKEESFNPTPKILHHIQDSYEWHLWGDISIPLPVILYTEGSFDVFMSSEFHHGKSKVVKGDRIYKIDHHHIVEENNKEFINISITKNVASMLLAVLAYFNVEQVSSNPEEDGVTVAMMVVLALPPNDSRKILVNLESR